MVVADEGERRGLLGIEQSRDQTVGLAVTGRTQCRATRSSKRALDLYSIVSARIPAPGHGSGACLIMVKTQAKALPRNNFPKWGLLVGRASSMDTAARAL